MHSVTALQVAILSHCSIIFNRGFLCLHCVKETERILSFWRERPFQKKAEKQEFMEKEADKNKVFTVLAFDLGASSGRAVKAFFDGEKLRCEEVHRFENKPHEKDGALRWDWGALLEEIHTGIDKAGDFDSVAFDTWGVDFGLLDKEGRLLNDPVHYRDKRTDGMVEKALAKMPAEKLYGLTGTQIMEINSLFQLLALREQEPETFEKAETLLFMPDLLAYAVSGEKNCERTIASTAQMLDPRTGAWQTEVLETFGIPRRLLLETRPSGSLIGGLKGHSAKVVSAAGHDTQCAAAAVPAEEGEGDYAFLSSGTWSLLGCELEEPILTAESMQSGLSNELGAAGEIDYLKNIIGLWLVQESRREWRRQGKEYSFAELERLALEAESGKAFIDPDDPLFTPPGDLPGRIQDYCRQTGQYVPQTTGEIMRVIYESLALKYRYAIEQLEKATGRKFGTLHIVGGGTKDKTLCRLTAEATGRRVVAGPAEATALGNIIIQLEALGAISSLAEGRKLIAEAEDLAVYEADGDAFSEELYEKYKALLETKGS